MIGTRSVPFELEEAVRRRGLGPELAHIVVVVGPNDLISICFGISNDESQVSRNHSNRECQTYIS